MPYLYLMCDRLFKRYRSEFKVWKSAFFMILSISFTMLVLIIDKLKDGGVFCLLSGFVVFIFLIIVALYIIIRLYKENLGKASVVEILPFMIFILLNILFIIRVAYFIVIPYETAQDLFNKNLAVEGDIISFIPDKGEESAFSNDILGMNDKTEKSCDSESRSDHILLKTKYGIISFYDSSQKFQYGDSISAFLCLTEPSPLRNPGGFDENKYFQTCGIYLKGDLLEGGNPRIIRKANFIYRAASFARSKIIRIFTKNLPLREAGLMAGLLIGDRSKMNKDDIASFQKAGLSHITAVSGSAITFLLIPIHAIFRKMKIPKKIKSVVIAVILAFFGFITGWSPSISRALLMVFIIILAKEIHIKVTVIQSLLIAISMLIALNPVFALNIGFWLSGMATAGIIQLSGSIENIMIGRYSSLKIIGQSLSTGIAAGLSVMPFAIWISNEVSLSSILSNIIILPVVGFSTILGSIQVIAGIINENYFVTNLLAIPLKGLLFLIYSFSHIIGGFEFLRINTHAFSFLVFISICVFIVFIFVKNKKSKRLLRNIALCLMISGVIHTVMIKMIQPEVRIIFADVAQGDATLIIMKSGESILIDSGSKVKGTPVMKSMLDFYNIKYPAIYINTHTHEDHCGGMIELIRERGGKTLFLPYDTITGTKKPATGAASSSPSINGESNMAYELLEAADDKKINVKEIGADDIIKIRDKFKITFYSPRKAGSDFEEKNDRFSDYISSFKIKSENDSCLILKIEYENNKILIMGDAPGDVEKELINEGFDLQSDIYRISHHGSPSSTNNDIISAVSPRISIISVGKNFYGHPSPKVIDRLSGAGSKIYRTDLNGAIILEIDKRKLQISSMIPQRGF
ncbi:MAG: DNA internalization-related competence protein ComEC/Rec2 [Saccharofermentanales bacterium]